MFCAKSNTSGHAREAADPGRAVEARLSAPERRGPYLGLGAILVYILVATMASAGHAGAETGKPNRAQHVKLLGDVPFDGFPHIEDRSDEIWAFLTQRLELPAQDPAPVIYFYPFDRALQSADWTAWQKAWTRTHSTIWRDWTALRMTGSTEEISQQWIDSNIDEIFPFPDNFLAFHYDGTNRIQINPDRTFRASIQNDPYGVRRNLDGYGYYSASHEMLHYALELKGVVPTKLHHCLFLHTGEARETRGLMEEVADFLVDEGIVAPIARHRGLHSESMLAPCDRLTPDEKRQVERFSAELVAPASGETHVRVSAAQ